MLRRLLLPLVVLMTACSDGGDDDNGMVDVSSIKASASYEVANGKMVQTVIGDVSSLPAVRGRIRALGIARAREADWMSAKAVDLTLTR
jgi:hypothetical protein